MELSVRRCKYWASSSNPALVSAGGLVIGGSGTNRTLTVMSNIGQTGSAKITISVTDGMWTNSQSFAVNVVQGLLSPDSPMDLVATPGDAQVALSWKLNQRDI